MVTVEGHGKGRGELLRFFGDIGYPDDLLRLDFPIWTGDGIYRVDVAAFGRAYNMDSSTATMVGEVVGSRGGRARSATLNAGRLVAAPAAVFWTPDKIELWAISADPSEDHRFASSAHDEVEELAGRFRSALGPESLLAAKRSDLQLSLFPVDVRLLALSKKAHSSLLSDRIEQAIAPLVRDLEQESDEIKAARIVDISRVVVASLAALVVRDKFQLDVDDGSDVFGAASGVFPGYFDLLSDVDLRREDVASVVEVLGQGIDYQSLDPAVISDVYEDAILTQSERNRLGIFYTPSALARRIAVQLPFEAVAPEDRVTLDPACGSGTLLLAAHDRLESLSPAGWDVLQSHEYVRNHLIGFDTDQFAVEIARLALLLNALPAGNRWQIERRNSPTSNPETGPRPNFIMSNPPWKDMRSRGGKRHQVADDFVNWMVRALQPGGHLAIVLPAGWLSSETSRSVRETLAESLRVYEVWRLPAGTFTSARLGAAVVFASKSAPRPSSGWVFRRVIGRTHLPEFYRSGHAQETLLAGPASLSGQGSLVRGPLDMSAAQLARLPGLGEIADIRSGPVPEPPVSERGGEGRFLWLRRARDLPAFSEAPVDRLVRVRFPEDFHKAGTHDGRIYEASKVFVSAKRSPDNPWRLKPALDTRGIVPRESLYMVTPFQPDSESLHGLLAYLASSFAACWIDQQVTMMAIDSDVLRSLPVPVAEGGWAMLDALGKQLVDVSSAKGVDQARLSEILRDVDEAVAQWVGLTPATRVALRNHFAGARGPEGSVRYPEAHHLDDVGTERQRVRRFGSVLAVDESSIRVWVPGVTPEEGTRVPLPPRIPGWLVTPGATFEVESSIREVDWELAEFHFQARSYMSDEDLQSVFEAS